MSVFTMFQNNMLHIMEDETIDLNYSEGLIASHNYDDRDDTLYFETDRFLLNQDEIKRLILPNFSTSEWVSINLRVNGEVNLYILADQYNSSIPIVSQTKIFGNSRFPGILQVSTINVRDIKIIGVSTYSLIESYASIIVEPTDSRLLTN